MDLINREDAINAIYHHIPYVSRKRATIILHEVQGMELIRCKDCKNRIEETRTGDLGCGFWARYVTKNGFCFMGDKGEKND